MNEQQIRRIAETAFKRQFPDVKLARVNVWPGVGFEDDSPVVDVHIIYDGRYEQSNADGLLDAQSGCPTLPHVEPPLQEWARLR